MPIFGNKEARIKPWENLTQREKVESLRHDVIKLDDALTTHGQRLDDLAAYIKDIERQQEKIMLVLSDLMQKQ
jgi:hypothetical protein